MQHRGRTQGLLEISCPSTPFAQPVFLFRDGVLTLLLAALSMLVTVLTSAHALRIAGMVRPYKPAWPVERAVEFLREYTSKHFNQRLVVLIIEQLPAVL